MKNNTCTVLSLVFGVLIISNTAYATDKCKRTAVLCGDQLTSASCNGNYQEAGSLESGIQCSWVNGKCDFGPNCKTD